jgi:hypothetical protein
MKRIDPEAKRGVITVRQLNRHGFHYDEVDDFRKLFGTSVTITEAKAKKVASRFFQCFMVVDELLPKKLAEDIKLATQKEHCKLIIPLYQQFLEDKNPKTAFYKAQKRKIENEVDELKAVLFARAYMTLKKGE